jgi:ribonuclease HII
MIIVGIDEVGRGCWAGPLVAAAVALREPIPGLKDSKKLSKLQREKLAKIIEKEALAIGIGWVWPEAIDTGGISEAVKRAMAEALAAIEIKYDEVIIDGNIDYFADHSLIGRTYYGKTRAVVRADDLFPSVSAASIIAKVARDRYMAEAGLKYPGYGFEAHVGYGTPVHIAALQKLGVTNIHRQSYKPIRALLELSQ